MDWQAVIKDYEGFLKLEKGLSPNSIEAYLGDIAKLKHFLESEDMNLGPEELDREKLGQFLVWISESGLSARSQARILSGIKVFYRYLMMEEMIEKDPTALLEGPRLGTKLPEVLTVNDGGEVVRMWMKADKEVLSEFLLIVGGDDNVLIYITGDFNMKELEELAESIDEDIHIDF